MRMCVPVRYRFVANVRQMLTARSFFILTCVSFAISVCWIQFVDKANHPSPNESLIREALENVARDYRYAEVYRKTERLSNDTKFILLWTAQDVAPFYYFGDGQRGFIQRNCSYINCFVTSDRNLFNGDTTKFSAIAFNGRNVPSMTKSQLPQQRSENQKFIYFNMESADYYPVCAPHFDNFFNWTSTYRLDSDIPYPYVQVRKLDGEVVGPKKDIEWENGPEGITDDLFEKIQNKSKAVAWFVSNCKSRNNRLDVARAIKKALAVYGHTVDIYGKCGPLKCPRDTSADCNSFLEKDYFFYLSFENSFADDYVTEKLLTAMQHDAVPIVFGGADYSRFLPPGSYLDARKSTPEELASTIADLMKYRQSYSHYFKWKNNYVYGDPTESDNVCDLCTALNENESQKTYENFRKWWNPDFEHRCRK